jgi:hypothetical protein
MGLLPRPPPPPPPPPLVLISPFLCMKSKSGFPNFFDPTQQFSDKHMKTNIRSLLAHFLEHHFDHPGVHAVCDSFMLLGSCSYQDRTWVSLANGHTLMQYSMTRHQKENIFPHSGYADFHTCHFCHMHMVHYLLDGHNRDCNVVSNI